jgi:hypothetical protein
MHMGRDRDSVVRLIFPAWTTRSMLRTTVEVVAVPALTQAAVVRRTSSSSSRSMLSLELAQQQHQRRTVQT